MCTANAPVNTGTPSSGRDRAVDARVSLWIGGLLFSLPLLAVKIGFGLQCARLGRRLVLLTYGLYLALFTGVTGWMILLSGAVERVVEGGPYLHGLVGTMMIAWGILAIRGLAPIVKRPLAMKDAWLLTLPCPAYLIAMVVSVRLVREFTHLPAPLVGAVLGTAFVALAGLSQLFLRAARGRPLAQTWQVAMALGMFSTGAYFLVATFLPGVLRDAGQVYASFIADGAEVGAGHSPWVWLMLAAVAVLGFFARRRSEMRP
jgi:predicted transporter